jgi:hypothetical protein
MTFTEKYHGKEGLLSVSQQSFQPMSSTWMEAGRELGYSNADPNARQIGSELILI